MKCGGSFSKGNMAICLAKGTTCTSCKFKGHLPNSVNHVGRRNVNIVNTQIIDNADFNPSDPPNINMVHENRESCGIINAWSESDQSENDDYTVLNITLIFDDDGKELKKFLNIVSGKKIK